MQRHEFSPVGLIFGVFFIGAAIIWGTGDHTSAVGHGWHLPALLVAVGVIGLLSVLPRLAGRPEEKKD